MISGITSLLVVPSQPPAVAQRLVGWASDRSPSFRAKPFLPVPLSRQNPLAGLCRGKVCRHCRLLQKAPPFVKIMYDLNVAVLIDRRFLSMTGLGHRLFTQVFTGLFTAYTSTPMISVMATWEGSPRSPGPNEASR